MTIQNEIYSGSEKGYIRWNKDMLTILPRTVNLVDDNGINSAGMNLMCYILDDLTKKIDKDLTISKYIINLTKDDLIDIVYNDPLRGKEKRAATKGKKELKVREMLEILASMGLIQLVTGNKIGMLSMYSSIFVDTSRSDTLMTIKLNPDFIEYYKEVKNGKYVYSPLYLDIMFSLSTYYQKMTYAYLCAYHYSMEEYGNSKPTSIDKLKPYYETANAIITRAILDKKPIPTKNLVRIVEDARDKINETIEYKREKYGVFIPKYKVKWIKKDPNATSGPNSRITHFKFSIDMADKKLNKDKYTTEDKLTLKQVIDNFTQDQDILDALYAYCDEFTVGAKALQTMLDNISKLPKDKLLDRIRHNFREPNTQNNQPKPNTQNTRKRKSNFSDRLENDMKQGKQQRRRRITEDDLSNIKGAE